MFCCACNKPGATTSTTAAIMATYFASTNLAHFDIVNLSIELELGRGDDTDGVAAGQCRHTPSKLSQERSKTQHQTFDSYNGKFLQNSQRNVVPSGYSPPAPVAGASSVIANRILIPPGQPQIGSSAG